MSGTTSSLSRRANEIQNTAHLISELRYATISLGRAQELFPRKHRLDPDDEEHPAPFAEGTYKLLMAAAEAILAAMEINQRAIPTHEGHECLPLFSEPVRQAAEASMARATQRRLDNEQVFLIRHGMEVPETHLRTGAGEANPDSPPTGNAPSGDCPLPSAKPEH